MPSGLVSRCIPGMGQGIRGIATGVWPIPGMQGVPPAKSHNLIISNLHSEEFRCRVKSPINITTTSAR
jgi:hypothetical protein